jgi:hypothetical protein
MYAEWCKAITLKVRHQNVVLGGYQARYFTGRKKLHICEQGVSRVAQKSDTPCSRKRAAERHAARELAEGYKATTMATKTTA